MANSMGKRVVQSEMPDTTQILSPETLGQLVRAKRTAMNMKLIDCAAFCGVGVNTLSRIERGNPNSTLGATFTVLQGLGIKLTTVDQGSPDDDWV